MLRPGIRTRSIRGTLLLAPLAVPPTGTPLVPPGVRPGGSLGEPSIGGEEHSRGWDESRDGDGVAQGICARDFATLASPDSSTGDPLV
ncbi:hypothetical protein NDU88_012070 [Pleurodeles waltl]|uniref:Secreted protein n=1 Tax=Pleurodeles waltl TaxID=8319 RepID=A0AAV7QZM1_PLEWA|nr:hypothetical protein NDU88_012070 [Pleurodeles waltl]